MESLLKYKIKSLLKSNEFYLFLQKCNSKKRRFVVRKHTDVIIEGFPRSANSWTCHVFQYLSQKQYNKRLKIASHLHASSQIKKGLKLNIPIILLIREPIDAVSSLLMMNKNLSPPSVLNDYLRMYNSLKKFKDKILVVKFDDIIQKPNKIIKKFNVFSNFDFSCELTNNDIEELKNQIKKSDLKAQGGKYTSYHVPTQLKEDEKKITTQHVEALKNKVIEANKLYQYFTNE
jgi:hypothetical protein